jgi:DNA polymerase-3 subunit delta'
MSWQGIEGHDTVVERFRRSLASGRLASTFLFVGPPGTGKRAFALKLAQTLLCQARPEERMDPCGKCPACIQVQAGTHPDLDVVSRPADKSTLPLELLIGPPEKRMQTGLCHNLSLKPFMGGRKVAIIDDADSLAEEGANALLKTLEEPPPRSVLILIGTSADRQLPTIRSRAQIVRFQPLPPRTVARILRSNELAGDDDEARRLARFSEGSLERAAELADAELWTFRRRLFDELASPRPDNVKLAPETLAFVDAAGKEAPLRRARMRQLIRFAAEFYRQLHRGLVGGLATDDPELETAVRQALDTWRGGTDSAGAALARSLDALEQIDRNANQSALLECWLDDLAQITLHGRPVTSP